jgi:Flp pilus assembly protein TadD
MDTGVESHRITALRQEIERSLRRAFDPADVLPRLARLARIAPAASDDGIFAHRQLAELLVEQHPWRAAIYARRALAYRGDDDRAWAVLAFCHTLLGNFRCAATAYKHAIASAPGNPWYAHNLGHLLDVALGAPERALPWLRSAYAAKAENSEIVASYVHALGRAGRSAEARAIVERALDRFDSRELEALLRWLDEGAPSADGRDSPRRGSNKRTLVSSAEGGATDRTDKKVPKDRRLAEVLVRGLSHLPLDSRQRARALALARDALAEAAAARHPNAAEATTHRKQRIASRSVRGVTSTQTVAAAGGARVAGATGKRRGDDVAGLAAAVAYAIVYVDHLPLSHAEVAAPFRVAVARLRGRFAELRAKLDIIPGDARYATTRTRGR